MVKRTTARDHERMMAEGKPSFAKDIHERMASLGGMRRSDLQRDDQRGHVSPLGRKKMKEGGKL